MASKINYKNLTDVTGNKTVTTVKNLSTEYSTTALKIAQILSTAGVEPVGKIPVMKDGRPGVGKPTLAFDTKAASKAMSDATASKAAA